MKDIKDESFVSVMKYREKWKGLRDEIKIVWELFLTEDGKFDGLTDFVMRKMWEAEARGRREMYDASQENKEDKL